MNAPWPRLVQWRERQKSLSAEAAASARRAAQRSVAAWDDALRMEACRVHERGELWRDAIDRCSPGARSLEQLRRASDFDRVASRGIVEARRLADVARQQAQQAQAASAQAQQALRDRCAALEKAERMARRWRDEVLRQRERRAEDRGDAAALAIWLRRRAP